MKKKIINVSMGQFNEWAKPFSIKRHGKKVSVVYYKKAADYVFELNKRIVRATDLIDDGEPDGNDF